MATIARQSFHAIVERDSEGIYVASVPSLPGCYTQAMSLDDLQDRLREAILLYLEETEAPEPLEFVSLMQVST